VDSAFRVVSAAAVRDSVFVAVGRTEDVRRSVGPQTRVIDAAGRTVIPGLIEGHVHALGAADGEAAQPFVRLTDLAGVLAWVRQRSQAVPPGTWIWTPRTFPSRLRERRFPTRTELDVAAPEHPVVVDGTYALAVNTAALRAAGITSATPDPAGGSIARDATGEPTGLLRNMGPVLARFDTRQPRQGSSLDLLERVHEAYAALGITSIVEGAATIDGYRAYQDLRRAGRLRVRAVVTLVAQSDGTRPGVERFLDSLPGAFNTGDEWLKIGPVKLFADGGILTGTAFMREPWGRAAASLFGLTNPADRGFLTLPPDRLRTTILAAHGRGWQVCAHVTGDAGVDAVLDAFEAANRERPITDRRFTLIHADFANRDAAARAAALGVIVNTQPAWYYEDGDVLHDVLGEERVQHLIGVREWLENGARVVLSSDHMFGLDPDTSLNPFNPLLTMYAAVTRRTRSGRVIGAAQAITREDALRMMTANAAYMTFDETRKGSIEVGKLGDLAILSDDPLSVPAERIKDITAVTTIVGGRVVYQRPQ
ncbi:MAG TPA: amidohydrolase, partial [Vicinamibacterales bacterium]|nr:amidohydrolase [Vicinamibacterales bacterium]